MENLVALDMSYSNIETFEMCYSYPQRLQKRVKQWIGSCSNDKRLLGSLKILNLSFCKQLRSLSGFEHFPKLERLILIRCISLLEVCESIEHCVELVLIDLSYCKKVEKLPRRLGTFKKLKILWLKGVYHGEPRIEIANMDSMEKRKAIDIGIITKTSSSAVLEAMPRDLKFFTITLPRSLVKLSLADNNLSNESFPMDFSGLSMLKELILDYNPIISMPDCLRSLPRVERLSMVACDMLTSVVNPPHTLTFLQIFSAISNPRLRTVIADPKIELVINMNLLASSAFEYKGMIKIQPIAGVEETVLGALGWSKVDFLIGRRLGTYRFNRIEESEIQMYYEFGIFSTIYGGGEMPDWIRDRSTGPTISFTIPSSPNNLTGLNFCYLLTSPFLLHEGLGSEEDVFLHFLPVVTISNITKKLTWKYQHYIDNVIVDGKYLTLLSHWMFGVNEIECGDDVTIMVAPRENPNGIGSDGQEDDGEERDAVTMECGVSFVYDDDEEEEDALGYYKSWNPIIGGDRTSSQSTNKTYILNINQTMQTYPRIGT